MTITSPHRTMIAFLDTEFTDLSPTPLLLSIALVMDGADRRVFYAEVTDLTHTDAASSFARAAVLPQFGIVPSAHCSYAQLRVRLRQFVEGLLSTLQAGECLEIKYASERDWLLFSQAIAVDANGRSAFAPGRVRPENVYNMANFNAGEMAARVYFKNQDAALISRHHALCDARALRIFYAAANAATAAIRRGLPMAEPLKPMGNWTSAHSPKTCGSVQTSSLEARTVAA